MFRIAALNDSCGSEDDPQNIQLTKTKEAKEAEAFAIYNKALLYQQKGHSVHAGKLLKNLLVEHPLLQEASDLVENEKQPSNHRGLQLLYSVHKNMASIYLHRNELESAIKSYIEAVRIDPSEVTVWFKMGQIALKLDKFALAKICFQQALDCNSKHWPSLDQAITVTYALGDYLLCLEYISTALENDPGYPKGLALKNQIFIEQPSLESTTRNFFINCDPEIHISRISKEDGKQFIDAAAKIRSKSRQLVNDFMEEQNKPIAFREPLTPFTWKHFGEQLIKLYDFATNNDSPKSLGQELDLRDYFFLDPTLFLGQDSSSDVAKSSKDIEKIKSPTKHVTLTTITTSGASTPPSTNISAFQRANEQHMQSSSPFDVLGIQDGAKESALLRRMQGQRLSPSKPKAEEGKDEEEPMDIIEAEQSARNPDNDDNITDIDMPLLESVHLDINLTDIQKIDLKPELLLKADDDVFADLADAKSLENVLSSVIDMECEREQKNDENAKNDEMNSVKDDPMKSSPSADAGSIVNSDKLQSIKEPVKEDMSGKESVQTTRTIELPEPPSSAASLISIPVSCSLSVSAHGSPQLESLLTKPIHSAMRKDDHILDIPAPSQPESSSCKSVDSSTRQDKGESTMEVNDLNDVVVSSLVNVSKVQGSNISSSDQAIKDIELKLDQPYDNSTDFQNSMRDASLPDTPKECLSNVKSTATNTFQNSETLSSSLMSIYHTPSTTHQQNIDTGSIPYRTPPETPTKKDISFVSSFDPTPIVSSVSVSDRPDASNLPLPNDGHVNPSTSSVVVSSEGSSEIKSAMATSSSKDLHDRNSSGQSQKSPIAKNLSPRRSTGDFIEDVIRSELCLGVKQTTHPSPTNPTLQQASSHFQESGGKGKKSSPSSWSTPLPPMPTQTASLSHSQKVTSPLASFPSRSKKLSSPGASASPYSRLQHQHSANMFNLSHLPSSARDLHQLHTEMALLNLPMQYLNSISTLEAESLLKASAEQHQTSLIELLRHQSLHHPRHPHHLSRSLSSPGYFSDKRDTLPPSHPLVSPPIMPSGGVPSSLPPTGIAPYPLGAPVIPGFPSVIASSHHPHSLISPHSLLSHQQDFSTGFPHPSLYSPLSPRSKYPLIPSTSPTYLRSRIPNLSLYDSTHLPGSLSDNLMDFPHYPKTATFSPRVLFSSSNSKEVEAPPAKSQKVSSTHRSASSVVEQTGPVTTKTTSFQDEFQKMIEQMLESSPKANGSAKTTGQALEPKHREDGEIIKRKTKIKNTATGTTTETKRGPKRKLDDFATEDWAEIFRGRSTRSRSNRGKKEKPAVDIEKLLLSHFPPSLLDKNKEMEENKYHDDEREVHKTKDKTVSEIDLTKIVCLANDESEAVKMLLKQCLKGHGILDLIFKYLLHLAGKVNCLWTEDLTFIFVQIYNRLRKHFAAPSVFDGFDGFTSDSLTRYTQVMLTHCELVFDAVRIAVAATSLQSPSCAGTLENELNIPDQLGDNYYDDMTFLSAVTRSEEVLGVQYLEYSVRVHWLKARYHQLQNETIDAIDCFQTVYQLIKEMKDSKQVMILLPNLKDDRVISLKEVDAQVDALQRSESLENTRILFDRGDFSSVVDNLLQTFDQKSIKESKERPSQLLLLQDSLNHLDRKDECLHWAEISIHEAIGQYRRIKSQPLKQVWANAMTSLFTSVNRVLSDNLQAVEKLGNGRLSRLSHNLVSVIKIILDGVKSSSSDMPINSLLPWILLYRILKYEEKLTDEKNTEFKDKEGVNNDDNEEEDGDADDDDDDDEESNLRPSIKMLIEAHGHLGRHGWCTREEGVFLFFLMEELKPLIEEDKEKCVHAYEQCLYCLYSHPNKRGKSRHIQEHSAKPITLTWERAVPVFQYFTQSSMPEFDSKKTSSITSDVESLLRRIHNLVPARINPQSHQEAVTNFIDGMSNVVVSSSLQMLGMAVNKGEDWVQRHLYYLLADYYLKNSELKKAVKFYMLDLTVNAARMDSWAGLALAKMSQIQQELSSIDLRLDSPAPKRWDGAMRCFQRAVDLDTRSRKLWMEYGLLAYQLQSHASRQAKMFTSTSSLRDKIEAAQESRKKYLNSAYISFCQACDCKGDGSKEDWLIHYMLGKIAEKLNSKKPGVFLDHYAKAAACLHKEKALYPEKIIFSTSPPHLALEALEVFYRVHASILKLLLSDRLADENLPAVYTVSVRTLIGNFANCKKHKQCNEYDREERTWSSNATATSGQNQAQSGSKNKKAMHQRPGNNDHSYSKERKYSETGTYPSERTNILISLVTSSQTLEKGKGLSENNSVTIIDCEEAKSKSKEEKIGKLEKDAKCETVVILESSVNEEVVKTQKDENAGEGDTKANKKCDLLSLGCSVPGKSDENYDGKSQSSQESVFSASDNVPVTVSSNVEDSDADRMDVDVSQNSSFSRSGGLETSVDTTTTKGQVKAVSSGQQSTQESCKIVEHEEMEVADSEDNVKERKDDEGMMDCVFEGEGMVKTKSDEDRVEGGKEDSGKKILQKQASEGFLPRLSQSETTESKADTIHKGSIEDDSLNISKKICDTAKHLSKDVVGNASVENQSGDDGNVGLSETIAVEMACHQEKWEEEELEKSTKEKTESVSLNDIKDEDKERAEEAGQKNKESEKTEKANVSVEKQDEEKMDVRADVTEDVGDGTKGDHQESKQIGTSTASVRQEDMDLEMDNSHIQIPSDLSCLKSELITNCIKGIETSASRFSSHYKSLYRLAHFYFLSEEQLDIELARDLLLGRPDWQDKLHMPAPGLFYERKGNNFFQGLWKIPIDDIDRSGSFASHVLRSVRLLLNILGRLEDLEMLYQIRNQMKRTPEFGKKYLRDWDRQMLVEQSFSVMLDVMEKRMKSYQKWSEEQREENLGHMFCVWRWGKGSSHMERATTLLHQAFRIMMKGRTDVNRLTSEQAILYCQQNLSKATIQQTTSATSSQTIAVSKSTVQSTPVKQPVSSSPSVTLAVTSIPLVTPDVTLTPSITPDVTSTPSVTPDVTSTPSVTPDVTSIPLVTPDVTSIPLVTPDVTSTPSVTPDVTSIPLVTPDVTSIPLVTPDVTSTPSVTPDVTSTPSVTPDVTSIPLVTPDVTSIPLVTPDVTSTPSVTPDVTSIPLVTPDVTSIPLVTPDVTSTPSVTPDVTSIPLVTPDVISTPSVTPDVTSTPSVTPDVTSRPSITPDVTSTPSVTPGLSSAPTITPGITSTLPVKQVVTSISLITPAAISTISVTPTVTSTPLATLTVTSTFSVTPTVTSAPSVTKESSDKDKVKPSSLAANSNKDPPTMEATERVEDATTKHLGRDHQRSSISTVQVPDTGCHHISGQDATLLSSSSSTTSSSLTSSSSTSTLLPRQHAPTPSSVQHPTSSSSISSSSSKQHEDAAKTKADPQRDTKKDDRNLPSDISTTVENSHTANQGSGNLSGNMLSRIAQLVETGMGKGKNESAKSLGGEKMKFSGRKCGEEMKERGEREAVKLEIANVVGHDNNDDDVIVISDAE